MDVWATVTDNRQLITDNYYHANPNYLSPLQARDARR